MTDVRTYVGKASDLACRNGVGEDACSTRDDADGTSALRHFHINCIP
jgi:hypothetical protein